MKKLFFFTLFVLLSLSLLLTACEDKGPAQEAGEQIDRAYEETKETLQEAGETLEDKVNPKGPAEKAGEKIDETIEDLKG